MRRLKDRSPPSTGNPEAAALIVTAQAKCVGCRLSWRIDRRRGMNHGAPANCICTAQDERQALREIAAGKVHTVTVTIRTFDRQSAAKAQQSVHDWLETYGHSAAGHGFTFEWTWGTK